MASINETDSSTTSEERGYEEVLVQELEGDDEPDFGRKKIKSLLSSTMNPPLTVKTLKRFLEDDFEDPNQVEDSNDGFGPIHYIVSEPHLNKQELLVCIAFYGKTDINLTTTKRSEITALHLACQNGDKQSVQTLIALGANVNYPDKHGNTPLDYFQRYNEHPTSQVDIQMKDLDRGATVMLKGPLARNLETEDITASQLHSLDGYQEPKQKKPKPVLQKILTDVGAVYGNEVQKCDDVHSPIEKEGKINCDYFRSLEKKVDSMLREIPDISPNPSIALEIAQILKAQESYRKVCGSRILCLDGGGIRGLVQMCILQEIENRTGKLVTELFDWIVGTSTGGIIALALIYGKTLSGHSIKSLMDIRNKYWQKKDEIFGKSESGLLGFFAKGNTKKLEEVLQGWLGENTSLKDVQSPCVLIPAVKKVDTDLKLHFFNNCFDDEFSQELVWKAARCTSAAPFYFSEYENYIDGGMLANNPSADALTKIQDFFRDRGQKLPISLVVSIGSGRNPPAPLPKIDMHKNFLNPKSWMNFFDVMESALLNTSAHQNCKSRCQEQRISYFRFNPLLEEPVGADQKDDQKLIRMLYKTQMYLANEKKKINELVSLLEQSELTSI